MNLYSVILGKDNITRNCFVNADSPQQAIKKAKEKYQIEENLNLNAITIWSE
jgi:hypothetical protein